MRNSRKKRKKRQLQTGKKSAADEERQDCLFNDDLQPDDASQEITRCGSDRDMLMKELADEKAAHAISKVQYIQGKSMARTFWERWRYELEERKQLQKANLGLRFLTKQSCTRM